LVTIQAEQPNESIGVLSGGEQAVGNSVQINSGGLLEPPPCLKQSPFVAARTETLASGHGSSA
jgi:hypothetical protein